MPRAIRSLIICLIPLLLLSCGKPPMTKAEYSREMTSIAKSVFSALEGPPHLRVWARVEDDTDQEKRAYFGHWIKQRASRLGPVVRKIGMLRPPGDLVENRRKIFALVRRMSKRLNELGEAQIRGSDREARDALLELESTAKPFYIEFPKFLKEAGVDESVWRVQYKV